jgi:hypothetical protein
MSNVLATEGVYVIEATEPHIVDGVRVGSNTFALAQYTGERWRAKHHAQHFWAKKYSHAKITVRWIGRKPDANTKIPQ